MNLNVYLENDRGERKRDHCKVKGKNGTDVDFSRNIRQQSMGR